MSKTIKYLLIIIILSTHGIFGCFNDEEKDNPLASYQNLYQNQETNGHLKLYITDAPVDSNDINGVYIAIREIQYNLQEEWKTFDGLDYPITYNLLELNGGKSALLDDLLMPAGQYNQIRFLLEGPEKNCCKIQPNSGSYISFNDDTTKPLYIPSGSQTGYKAIGVFRVPINGVVEITADFDMRRGLVQANGKYILKPTIRLIVNNEAGRISGSITNNSVYSDIIVYAYEDGTWSDTEDDDPAESENRFPGSVTSGKMDDYGNYILPFLAAGIYDLAITGYTGDTFGEVLGFISDLVVEAEKNTIVEIDTSDLEPSL